ncbi:DUF924 family protein [Tropicimonas sp. IMCC34043]|uniref:DUF924 family protein n=1 Tax=Tropicimonas sp. IMCC34043 TaxID=2248760 RepID=UPI001E314436|nr:DUF924 family protein [Tropicimonas sp. IMCC34043]
MPQDITTFWVDEVGPTGWYAVDEALDAKIRDRFQDAWEAAGKREFDSWVNCAEGAFAFLILTDQFPRNMFRGDARAFRTDAMARSVAKLAIDRRWDLAIPEPQRQFFYLPLMHSENLIDQDRCVRLLALRMPETGEANLRHARAHREVIRKFGRFPFRNAALGRMTLPVEEKFLEAGGYSKVVEEIED